MRSFILLTGISCCVCLYQPVIAQGIDSLPNHYGTALSVYHSLLSPETGLYKGNEYLDYRSTLAQGSPFFDLVPFNAGSVVYHDIFYRDVFIAYDVVADEVVIYDALHRYMISLIKNEVSRFTTSGFSFVQITKDSVGAARMRSGFYEIIYEGNVRVLKKETRSVQERSPAPGSVERFTTGSADYFIKKKGVYYSANNKSSFLSAVKDKEKELKAFIRKKRLKFRKNSDADLAIAAAYYDAITK